MKPPASLSLDLDNLWSYLKIHGDAAWTSMPSYLDAVVPRFLRVFEERQLRATVFVVGADAARSENREAIAAIPAGGHEIGNHSYHHEPWIARCGQVQAYDELTRAHEAIAGAAGQEPSGFRGPGFASSMPLRTALVRMRYRYDASRLPTFIGPIARWYYFRSAALSPEQRSDRSDLFGGLWEGMRPNRPRLVTAGGGALVDVPVTTMPWTRLPMHFSYVHYLDRFSPALADRYLGFALDACRVTRTPPSLLLHPLDFLGCEDVPSLRFFPGMDVPRERKLAATRRFLDRFSEKFSIFPIGARAWV